MIEYWNSALDVLPDGVLIFDRAWRVAHANPAAVRIFQAGKASALLGRRCDELLHGKLVPPSNCPVCRQKRIRTPVEWRGSAPVDGEALHISMIPAPRDQEGGVLMLRSLGRSPSASSCCDDVEPAGSSGVRLPPTRDGAIDGALAADHAAPGGADGENRAPATLRAPVKGAISSKSTASEPAPPRAADGECMVMQGLFTALRDIEFAVHVIDYDSYEILWANELKKRQFGWDIVGRKCYEAFQGRESPCAHCRNGELVVDGAVAQAVSWVHRDALTGDFCLFVNKAFEWPDGRMAKIEMTMDLFDIPGKVLDKR